jgi:hypothetical protein
MSVKGRSKYTIQDAIDLAIKNGGACLSITLGSIAENLLWKCKEGHTWSAPLYRIKDRNSWCRECKGLNKLTIEDAIKIAELHDGECLSKIYINCAKNLLWRCKEGHEWLATLTNVKNVGNWCAECSGVAKLTIEKAKELALKNNGKCLSDVYLNNKEYLMWECSEKHIWSASYVNINGGSWCPDCNKYNIEDCQIVAMSRGGECLSKMYKNIKDDLQWRCSEGHVWLATFASINGKNSWCGKCAGVAKLTIEEMKDIAISRNGECLSDVYINCNEDLEWKCAKGHKWFASAGNIKNGESWCAECIGHKKYTIEDCKKFALDKGGKCLSDIYENIFEKLKWECGVCFYQWSAAFTNINNGGCWCPKCAGNAKLSIEDAKNIAIKNGGECLSNIYDNNHEDLLWRCKNGHEWSAALFSIRNNETWCRKCKCGKYETIVRKFFEFVFGYEFPSIRPHWLKNEETGRNLELDGYCAELNIAFEYQGPHHYKPIYGEDKFKIVKKKDLFKVEKCKKENVNLIVLNGNHHSIKELILYLKSELYKICLSDINFNKNLSKINLFNTNKK